jgi:hypothetical protein
MDETFMHSMRGEPRVEFARQLEAKLERQTRDESRRAPQGRLARFAALAASLAIVTFAFTFPEVRAAARSFLDLFRVVNFAAVPVNLHQLQALRDRPFDLPHMLGDQVQVLKDPGKPVTYPTPEAAGAANGLRVRLPAWLPVGWEVGQVVATGESSARVVANTEILQQILQALQINDVEIPDGLNGQAATLTVPPTVMVTYRDGGVVVSPEDASQRAVRTLTLLQSRNPSVTFPAGVDLAKLGEIALRILGLDRAEAYRFAQSIDWRTTLIVPVPLDAARFRQVDVQGRPGLLIERRSDGRQRGGTMLLWSSGEQVFALMGPLASPTVLEVAGSMQ